MASGNEASLFDKFSCVPLLVLVDFVAITTCVLKVVHWTGSPESAAWVAENRSNLGIAVQIVAHVLGFALVYTLRTVVKLGVRRKLAQSHLSLGTLRLATAICNVGLDWSLNVEVLVLVGIFLAFTLVPAAVWAGSLTPVVTTAARVYQMNVPAFTNATGFQRAITFPADDGATIIENKGAFTFAGEFLLQGPILNSAQSASNRTSGDASSHAKLDKTGYTYTTRSYGAGSAVGLTDNFPQVAASYKFSETSLLMETSCIYNQTSDWTLSRLDTPGGWDLVVYNAVGYFPNNEHVIKAAAAFLGGVVAMATAGPNYVVLASDGGDDRYDSLNKVQCVTTFQPTAFAVSVDVLARTIDVEPQGAASSLPNADNIAAFLLNKVNNLGTVLSTTQYGSLLGETFLNNIANVQNFTGDATSQTEVALQGIAASLDSMFDNLLTSVAAAQLIISDNYNTTQVQAQVPAVVFGELSLAILTLAASFLVTLLYIFEMVRTRIW